MRTVCLALLATMMCLSFACAQQWLTHPVMDTLTTPQAVRDIAVSPTGNQIAWVNVSGLSIHTIRNDRTIGELHKRIELPYLVQVAFVPGGRQVICADSGGKVYLIKRSDWSIRTVEVPGARNASEIEVIEQRHEAYISYDRDPHLAVVNCQDATLVQTAALIGETTYYCVDAVVAPAGDFVVAIAAHYLPSPGGGAGGRRMGYLLPQTGRQYLLNHLFEYDEPIPRAACVGPDPDHMLLISGADKPLSIVRLHTDEEVTAVNLGLDVPMDVANSNDGRFIAVADMGAECLKVISGADVRGLMDPNFHINVADVRTHTVPLSEAPAGVTLHPDKAVAYVWSFVGTKIWAVRIGLPGV